MPLEQLTVTSEELSDKKVTVLCLKGYLDSHTFDTLQQSLTDVFDRGSFKIILDLTELNYMSSAGAGVLIGAMSQASNNGGGLVLVNMSSPVLEVFGELGLADVFQIVPTRKDALPLLGA